MHDYITSGIDTHLRNMKRAAVTTLTLVESGKRSRRDDDDDSDSSEESLEGNKATKRPEELKAITWKLFEPVLVTIIYKCLYTGYMLRK